MSDPSGIRERIADILRPTVLADMRFPDEFWADRRALNMADDLIKQLGLCEFTGGVNLRWWATAMLHQDDNGEWQWPANPSEGVDRA